MKKAFVTILILLIAFTAQNTKTAESNPERPLPQEPPATCKHNEDPKNIKLEMIKDDQVLTKGHPANCCKKLCSGPKICGCSRLCCATTCCVTATAATIGLIMCFGLGLHEKVFCAS